MKCVFFQCQDRHYTVMMLDPDAPNHRPGQFYLHWMIVNVPVSKAVIMMTMNLKAK